MPEVAVRNLRNETVRQIVLSDDVFAAPLHRHLLYEAEVEAAMGLPPGVHSYAILPIGYPIGRFGPVGRGSLADFVYEDRWGNTYSVVK